VPELRLDEDAWREWRKHYTGFDFCTQGSLHYAILRKPIRHKIKVDKDLRSVVLAIRNRRRDNAKQVALNIVARTPQPYADVLRIILDRAIEPFAEHSPQRRKFKRALESQEAFEQCFA
jgi:hypothetical protein